MRRAAPAVLAALLAVSGLASADSRIFIPVDGTPVRLEAFVYSPDGPGPHPVVIYSHGSSAGHPKASLRARRQAQYFVARGFTVLVPMRRGRGASTGESLESEDKNCDLASWKPGLASAFDDLTAAIDHARTLPGVAADSLVLAGASRGGFLSVAYAAEGARRSQVRAVINFAGGWVAQAEDRCPEDFNASSFAAFGPRAAAPMLWVYGGKDPFYEAGAPASYAHRFLAAGGRLDFVLLHDQGHDVAEDPRRWPGTLDALLAPLSRPTAPR